MSETFLNNLNTHQRKAVEIIDGPVLILAGAGSGKTRCLSYRTGHIMNQGISGDRICAVTFTNKAAKEMQDRIEKLTRDIPNTGRPTVGTFHSLCVRILRQHIEHLQTDLTQQFVIFDTNDTQNLLKNILKNLHFEDNDIKPKNILRHFSSAKNQLLNIEDYTQSAGLPSYSPLAKTLHQLFPIYEKNLKNHNALDFDDLLQKTVELLEKTPDIRTHYQTKWNYLMVDEYQDTNFAQYRLIRLLSEKHQNLCVIGDDHQSIYSFRGADYTNILNFEKDFPKAKIVKLEQNYRSTKHILSCANTLISHNQSGLHKKLWTENQDGEKVRVIEVADEKAEGNIIAEKIKEITKDGEKTYADCAVLYRMNAQSRAIEEAFMRNQIPYQIIGGTRFFDRKEIKDIIAYLRLIWNTKDDLSFLRVINVPSRKLGSTTIEILQEYAQNYHLSLFEILKHVDEITTLNQKKRSVLAEFRDLILSLQSAINTVPISSFIDMLIKKIGYEAYLDDGTSEGESRKQNVQELLSVANKYDHTDDGLASFLEGVALIADVDNYEDREDRVTLMTIHSAKGLEFPIVFLPGWEDGIFPSGNGGTIDLKKREEERRLGYVAITRAEEVCTLLWCRERMLFGRRAFGSASPFLEELDHKSVIEEKKELRSASSQFGRRTYDEGSESYKNRIIASPPKNRTEALWGQKENESEFKTGQKIAHTNFGEGTIIMVSGDVLSVAFKGIGIRKIVGSVAPITVIEEKK